MHVLDLWLCPSLWFTATWLICSNTYAVLDAWQPEWYRRISVNRDKQLRLGLSEWCRLFRNNLRNLLLSFCVGYLLFTARLAVLGAHSWTSNAWLHLIGCYLWGEVWFYGSHRLIHAYPALCRFVHHQHHEYHANLFSMVGFYSTVSEMLIINLPLAIGFPVLALSPPWVTSAWLTLLAWHIANNHSGHRVLPTWLDDPAYHLAHHQRWDVNYGAKFVHWFLE